MGQRSLSWKISKLFENFQLKAKFRANHEPKCHLKVKVAFRVAFKKLHQIILMIWGDQKLPQLLHQS